MDNENKRKRKINPKQTASIFSRLTFWYTRELFKKGFKQELEEEDLYEVLPEYDSCKLGDSIEQQWGLHKDRRKFPPFYVFWYMFGKFYILFGLTRIISIITSVLRPIIIGNVVSYFIPNQQKFTKGDVYLYSLLLVGLYIIDAVCTQNYNFVVEGLAIKVRTAICSLIYRKFLKLPASHLRHISFGKIINLITRDINIFDFSFLIFNQAWIGLIANVIICYNMYQRIGLPAVVAMTAFALFIPFQGKKMLPLYPLILLPFCCEVPTQGRTASAVLYDSFLGMQLGMQSTGRSSAVHNKRAIKLGGLMYIVFVVLICTWTGSLKIKTSTKTDKRIGAIQEVLSNIRSTKMYVWEKYLEQRISAARREEMDVLLKMFSVFFFSLVIAIVVYNATFYLVLMTCVWLDQPLTAETMYFITGCFISMSYNLMVSIPYAIFYGTQVLVAIKRMQALIQKLDVETQDINETLEPKDPSIQFRNVTVCAADKVILKNVSLKIDRGLTVVNGFASSGKTVILMTILKEFEVSEGCLIQQGRISYVPQEPWLFPSTIRQNIIFGCKYDEKRYQDVIKTCALQYDIDIMEKGDSTVVADRGINLSKGQKTRINLARAIYKESDIYLLDDCLSSLDPIVARFIFNNCILKFLREKLVILVSRDSNLIPYASNILTLVDGNVQLSRNVAPQTFKKVDDERFSHNETTNMQQFDMEDDIVDSNSRLINTQDIGLKIYKEDKKTGPVSSNVYKAYVNLGGGIFFSLIIFCLFFLTQFSVSYKDKLISIWANLEEQISQSNASGNSSNLTEERNSLLYSYTAAIFGISFTTLIRAYALFLFTKRVSINLHKKMLNSLLSATLLFFDRTFIGNMINRFSKDLITIDENIPFFLLHLLAIAFETAGNLFLISFISPRLLVPIGLVFISFVVLKNAYLKIGRPLKRLDASTKSPVIGYLNATLEGLTSIKAFRAQHILKEEFERRQNLYTSASYSNLCCIKAFVFGAENLISLFIAIVLLQFIIFDESVLPGDVGLAVSQAFIMGISLSFGIYKWADLETQMTSVERALDYTVVQPETRKGLKLKDWTKSVEIKFQNVYLSLNNSKFFLLKNINFCIQPNEKIGIVGRTGAGKSSIVSSLFRLYETEGTITIDGVDIKTLSLDFLRSHISVIPQDIMLFTGTLRDNIDPGRIHTDQEIWNAIASVKLKHVVSTLDIKIEDLELTCGQKQLICMARVLIKEAKIVMLDEMVENLDSETECLIHEIIDRNFASCTVIKIAHKLKFVMTCDKIMVMDNAEVVEYDSPSVLLRNRNSLFYKMVLLSGLDLGEYCE